MSNESERAAAFKACPDTGCDWGAFLRGFQAGAAYQRTQAQPADALVEALEDLVKINEDHNKAVQEIIGGGVTLGWKDSYLDKAREALAAYRAAQEKK